MPKFEIETFLSVTPEQLQAELLSMSGVNYELAPIIQMSVPEKWATTAITLWPTHENVFTSTVLLFGVLPVDRHCFKLLSVTGTGFTESSKTLLNSVWSHQRTITKHGSGANVKDVVYYTTKIPCIGSLLRPVYRSIFMHRHKRLKLRYAEFG
ncbi:hypothetical protein [Arenicella xantha]|uniref:Polyketide cyclase/dehydrase/lipid transport protein n=1 Tax=Arenicella xantha TaxID=644221 RepID=A0A395JVS2_9GAMM|nr:hypothetical protein [Arenicella xantha]RBP53668.1 hypothetical protein DFR28_1011055 [Arenicella xantha]